MARTKDARDKRQLLHAIQDVYEVWAMNRQSRTQLERRMMDLFDLANNLDPIGMKQAYDKGFAVRNSIT